MVFLSPLYGTLQAPSPGLLSRTNADFFVVFQIGFGTGTAWYKDDPEDPFNPELVEVLKAALAKGFILQDIGPGHGGTWRTTGLGAIIDCRQTHNNTLSGAPELGHRQQSRPHNHDKQRREDGRIPQRRHTQALAGGAGGNHQSRLGASLSMVGKGLLPA